MKVPIALCIPALLFAQTRGGDASTPHGGAYVVLISIDGMRPEYLDRIDLPNIGRVMARGVRAEGMRPAFPSKTYPNHFSIVTGLYVENHGIVANHFYDPERRARYTMHDSLAVTDGSWYRGEPIWSTAEKQGLRTASYFWPGSEAVIAGARPSIYKKYDGRVGNGARADSAVAWLSLPAARRPHMISLYFSTVDEAGHSHGPFSRQVDTATAAIDAAIGRLLAGIDRLPLRDSVHLILVSDHGMSEASPRWYAALDTLIDLAGVRIADGGPNANLHIQGGIERAAVLRDSINRRMRHGRAYLRSEIPGRLRYARDPRVGDVVVIMDDHWQVGSANYPPREGTAAHGWEPVEPTMHAIFIVMGPGIPAGKRIPVFDNVHVYDFMASLLGLTPAPNDGLPGYLASLIRR